MNAYIGAWVTAGVAVGSLFFAAIQAIAKAISSIFTSKSNNKTQIRLKEMQQSQKQKQGRIDLITQIQRAFSDYCGYTAALLASNGKVFVNEQAKAFGELILYIQESQNVVVAIQKYIANDDFENASDNFNRIIPVLKKEETSLLSPLKSHSPKDYTDDFLDSLIEQGKKQTRQAPTKTITK